MITGIGWFYYAMSWIAVLLILLLIADCGD